MAETLPPMTIEQLKDALKNPNFSTYVFIGDEGHTGWKMAMGAQKILPALRVYRVDNSVAGLVKNEFSVNESHIGIVFDWTTDVKQTLSEAEATDYFILTEALINARS